MSSNGISTEETSVNSSSGLEPEMQHKIEKPKNQNNRTISSTRLTMPTLFIGGLAPAVGRIHLEKLFQKFGTVVRLDIKSTASNSKYGFCEFRSIEEAQKTLDSLDGRMLLRRRLVVKPANQRNSNNSMQPSIAKTTEGETTLSPHNLQKKQLALDAKIQKVKRKIAESKSRSTGSER